MVMAIDEYLTNDIVIVCAVVLSYKTAMKCISYLSSNHLVREDRLLLATGSNSVQVKRLLKAIENSEVCEVY